MHSHISSTHDRITGVKGSFHDTLSGLRNLRDLDVPLIIRFIAMRQNYKDAPDISKLVVEEFPRQRLMLSGLCYMGFAAQRIEELGIRFSDISRNA